MTTRAAVLLLLLLVLGCTTSCADEDGDVSSGTVALRQALEGCDRIVVRPGGHPSYADERNILFEVAGSKRVGDVITGIEIKGDGSGALCACMGSLTLQFYRGASVTALLTYHHGESLRWEGGSWSGDGQLSPLSRAFLRGWFLHNGIEDEALLGG